MLSAMFEGYLAELAMRSKPATITAARSACGIVQREFGDVRADSLDRLALEEWRRSRSRQGRANRTINRDMTTLGAAFRWAVDRGLLAVNPARQVKKLPQKGTHRRRIGRAASDDEIRRLVVAAESIDARHPKRFPRAPLLRALFETGCRWGELVATTWADLDTDESTLFLRFTKTDTEREVDLLPSTLAAILALRRAHVIVCGDVPRGTDRIFLSPNGKPLTHGTTNFHPFLHECLRVAKVQKVDATGRILPRARRAKVVYHAPHSKRRTGSPDRKARRD